MPPRHLPQLDGQPFVTDAGLETELIFDHGIDLPDFAAFPLVEDAPAVLRTYYEAYAGLALRSGVGLLLETPTWRASADWGDRLGWSAAALDSVNREAVRLLREVVDAHPEIWATLVSGQLGPRGDGYHPDHQPTADEAAAYHRPQIASLAGGGADMVHALTLTGTGEAAGVVQAARDVGVAVAVSFTVETDGRLPDGTTLADAVATLDDTAAPDYVGINCAHPDHIAPALALEGSWRERVVAVRANASTRSHAELDDATELDAGDPTRFGAAHLPLGEALPRLTVLGGCCGTDIRHVSSIWETWSARPPVAV
ncbi:homocysteine S-methyltransferase family protein [Nocardioides coralli]|uniref:homocysteine S-methyltransferase family protein n=1 Tax=Nocardioides coralli TaxID=2872154 RepID=UPI001CA3DF3D|nr:homocysteine S-methyltransferase family protein [Nocardioides coralli]QZY29060.1 homocysteine S-methyltransferase family protein [Nocardioides coralli]